MERCDDRDLRESTNSHIAEVKFARDKIRMDGLAQVRGAVAALCGDWRLEAAKDKTDRAAGLDGQGKHAEAFVVLREALIVIEELSEEKFAMNLALAATYDNMGTVYKHQGKCEKALRQHQKCLTMQIR
ncbi:hypothetical protein T484DRAFT_1861807 [Baffinella frigidus]|nr:hypothetical protein T484DRAFT_1861807 [Cryptophyta sp. CCMP2293]